MGFLAIRASGVVAALGIDMKDSFAVPRQSSKVLLVSVLPSLFSARLVLGLEQLGAAVAVVCPTRHPIHHLRRPPLRFPLGIAGANSWGPFGACARVKTVIEHFRPDAIIPCDDYAAQILHRIARSAPARTARLIENSLGPIAAYATLESKTVQVALARHRNIRTPVFEIIGSRRSLREALGDVGLPAFMKRDDSWAGQGVRRITDEADLDDAWRELSQRHSVIHALKNVRQMGLRHALAGIRRTRPAIHLQAAIAGQPANRTIVCHDGEIIGGFSLVAVATSSENGPASVVRVADNPEMAAAAEVLAKELRLSGLVGFDFVVAESGAAYFLEINARATPAATLSVADSPDLLGILLRTLTPSSAAPARAVAGDTIALFPDEMLRDEASPFLETAHHDVPADEPGLIEFGMAQIRDKAVQEEATETASGR
jgi:ATP-grasp domain-containing protein